VTSQRVDNDAIRQICFGFLLGAQCTPTSYLAPLPRYSRSKVDRKRFRPYGDVTGRKRRRHSIDRPRFPIGAQCTPTSYLAPLPRYSGSKVDRKRFRPYGDVTERRRRRHSTDLPRFPIGGQCIPTSYLAPLMRYSGSKVDRKRFRPYGDVTGRKATSPFDRPTTVSYGTSMHADLVSRTVTEISRFERWTGSGFGHTVTSQTLDDDAIRQILPRFPIGGQCTPTSYLAPLPRYSGSKVDRKRFRPYGDVTDRKRRRHSTDRPRFPIGAQCTPTSYLAPLPRYSGSKVDRKRFRAYDDVTDRNRRRRSKDRPRFAIGAQCMPTLYLLPFPRYGASKSCRRLDSQGIGRLPLLRLADLNWG
jgi:hypothetical protein